MYNRAIPDAAIGAAAPCAFEHDNTTICADLHEWLPTVLDDALLRDAIERALRKYDLTSRLMRIAGNVYAAVAGRPAPVRLSSTIALIHVAADLHDDVTDGHAEGGAAAEALALIVAGTMAASIAPQAVLTLVIPAEAPAALHALWNGLRAMASGQYRDLALYGASHPDPHAVEAALAKSTAACGLYAVLGARAAGVTGEALTQWERFGAAIGYAIAVSSDCRDALDFASRDIAAGARTLPIALALQPGAQGDPESLRRALDAAPYDLSARRHAREAIAASGSVAACGTLVEAAVARAERILAALAPPHRSTLETFIGGLSWLRRA